MSGLPPFLVEDSGLNSGFMVPQVTAAALASENKSLAHPASVDSLPTSANQEDHVSMATSAALRLHRMVDNTAGDRRNRAACRVPRASSSTGRCRARRALEEALAGIRAVSPRYARDRPLAGDIRRCRRMILGGQYRQRARLFD